MARVEYPPGPIGQLARERTAITAGTAVACGHTCDCHGGHLCVRAQHPEDTPHLGNQVDGSLVQWTGPCPPVRTTADGTVLTEEQYQDLAVANRRAATAALLASIDIDTLAAALQKQEAGRRAVQR